MKKQEFAFEIQSIENGSLLNRISGGEIIAATKGKVLSQTFFKSQEELKEIVKENLFIPFAEKGKLIKFKITIEVE